MKAFKRVLFLLGQFLFLSSALAAEFHIGPDQTYSRLADVAFHDLSAGDTVYIHYRETPYSEKIRISGQGTQDSPIRIIGVPGPNGELPIIDGENATTHPADVYSYEPLSSAGVITVFRGPTRSWGYRIKWLEIENLEIRGARTEPEQAYYTNAAGTNKKWLEGAAGLYLLGADQVTIRNCDIHSNANGVFFKTNSVEDAVSNIRFEGNRIYNNAEVQQLGEDYRFATHNVYGEGQNVIYEGNYFGPVWEDRPGANLKDRSAGLVVKNNWIEGGVRLLDIVEAQDSFAYITANAALESAYRRTEIAGNILVSGPGDSITAVHYGGDSGNESTYRKGELQFEHNTVYVHRDQSEAWRFIAFDLSTDDESLVATNNVLHIESDTPGATPTQLSLMEQYGSLRVGRNWVKQGYYDWHDGREPSGSISGGEQLLTGDAPGFVDAAGFDFAPGAGSPLLDQAQSDVAPPERQYQKHNATVQRDRAGSAFDLGAFEAESVSDVRDPELTSPIPNSTLTSNVVDFSWDGNGSDVNTYWLYVGSVPGAYNYHNSGNLGVSSSTVVSGLPTNGTQIFIRFWFKINGENWRYQDYSVNTLLDSTSPTLTSHSPGEIINGSTVDFSWSGSGINNWWLYIGTVSQPNAYFDSGLIQNATRVQANNLPADGSTVIVRLWYRSQPTAPWRYVDSVHTNAAGGL